jgi:hypothetical protein
VIVTLKKKFLWIYVVDNGVSRLNIERNGKEFEPSISSIDACVVEISVDGGQAVSHGFVGAFLHLFLGRRDEVGGTKLEMIFGQEKSI